jgi:hypothetical protein
MVGSMRNVRSLYQRWPDAAEQSGSRSRSTLEREREEEQEEEEEQGEEEEQEKEQEEEEEAGGFASSSSSGVWLRGLSTLLRRPIPLESHPLIRPTRSR